MTGLRGFKFVTPLLLMFKKIESDDKTKYNTFNSNSKAELIINEKLAFKDIKFQVKFRDIHKIEKNNCIDISVFGYENKEKHPIYVSKKCCEEKHVDLLLIGEEGKRHLLLIKDFNTFMYDHTLHR